MKSESPALAPVVSHLAHASEKGRHAFQHQGQATRKRVEAKYAENRLQIFSGPRWILPSTIHCDTDLRHSHATQQANR